MSYEAVHAFVRRELASKVTIDSAVLDHIETKLRTALASASTAGMSPRNLGRINPAFLQAHMKYAAEKCLNIKKSSVSNLSQAKYLSAKRQSMPASTSNTKIPSSKVSQASSPYKEIRRAASQLD